MRKTYDLVLNGNEQLKHYAQSFAKQVKDRQIYNRGPIVYCQGGSDLLPNILEIFRTTLSKEVPQATIHILNLAILSLDEQLRLILHNLDPALETSTLNEKDALVKIASMTNAKFIEDQVESKKHVLAVVVPNSANDDSIAVADRLRSSWAAASMPTLTMTTRQDVALKLMGKGHAIDYGNYVKYSAK